MGQIVNKAQLASIVGKSERTLTTWLSDGMPQARKADRRGQSDQYDTEHVINWMIARASTRSGVDGPTLSLEEERTRLTKWQADKEELTVSQLKRNLIPAEEIEEVWERFVMACRASGLALPDRLKQMLSLSDEQRDVVDDEVRMVLEKLGNYDAEAGT